MRLHCAFVTSKPWTRQARSTEGMPLSECWLHLPRALRRSLGRTHSSAAFFCHTTRFRSYINSQLSEFAACSTVCRSIAADCQALPGAHSASRGKHKSSALFDKQHLSEPNKQCWNNNSKSFNLPRSMWPNRPVFLFRAFLTFERLPIRELPNFEESRWALAFLSC